MVNRARSKGTYAETAVTTFMTTTWWPAAERRSLKGGKDMGDINPGTKKLVVEVKADKALTYPQYLRETEAERVNAGAEVGVCVIKPPGFGKTRLAYWWMLLSEPTWVKIEEAMAHPTYRGPSVLWFTGDKQMPRAFQPGKWLQAAGDNIAIMRNLGGPETLGVHIVPGAARASSVAGRMRFMYLGDGLELLAAAGFGAVPYHRLERKDAY